MHTVHLIAFLCSHVCNSLQYLYQATPYSSRSSGLFVHDIHVRLGTAHCYRLCFRILLCHPKWLPSIFRHAYGHLLQACTCCRCAWNPNLVYTFRVWGTISIQYPSGSRINAMCLIFPSVRRFLNGTPNFSKRAHASSTLATVMAM